MHLWFIDGITCIGVIVSVLELYFLFALRGVLIVRLGAGGFVLQFLLVVGGLFISVALECVALCGLAGFMYFVVDMVVCGLKLIADCHGLHLQTLDCLLNLVKVFSWFGFALYWIL